MGDARYTFEKVAYSSVVGQSVMVINEDGACVAQLSVMVPNPTFDYRETAEAVAEYICNSKRQKDALDFLASEGQHCDAIEAAVKDTWERAAKIADARIEITKDQRAKMTFFDILDNVQAIDRSVTAEMIAAAMRAEGGDV